MFRLLHQSALCLPSYFFAMLIQHSHYSIHHSGADISVRDNNEMTPLMLAIKAGNVEIVAVMLDLGCDIHSEAKNDKSLIVWAIENEYTVLLKVY